MAALMTEDEKAIQKAAVEIKKDLDLPVQKLKDVPVLDVKAIRSGSYLLDKALGVGGYPRGRIIETFGVPSGGKTTISLMAIAEAQKAGGIAAFIDVEYAFSKDYAASLGVDVDNLYFVQPEYGEQALEALERLVRTNKFDIIVLDSTAALVPLAEVEADMEKQSMALLARLMSKALRKLTPVIGKSKTVVIFINQTRQNVGVMYGNPVTTPGGDALKFYSSVRLNVRKIGGSTIGKKENPLGHRIHINLVKNKVAPPLRTAELDFYYATGIDKEKDMIEYALNAGLVTHSGNTFSMGDKKWVGRDKAIEALKEDPILREELVGLINSSG